MIDPSTVNPFALPSVLLEDRLQLPTTPCIYFAIDSNQVVQYIGRSVNPALRWTNHFKTVHLSQLGEVRIAYLAITDPAWLSPIESILINWFKPH